MANGSASSGGPRWVFFPTLVAGDYALDIALANKIEPAGFARSVLVALLVGAAFTVVGWAVTRDRWLGGLVALSVIVVAISRVPIVLAWQWANATFGGSGGSILVGLILLVTVGLPLIVLLRARRSARTIRGPAASFLNRLAVVLVVVTVIVHIGPDLPGMASRVLAAREVVGVNPPGGSLPDIYVVLLDGYPRADILQRKFGIDNSGFLRQLQTDGFDVSARSQSNYVFTALTLASFFQMQHLENVPGLQSLVSAPDAGGTQVNALRDAISRAPSFVALQAAGYQIVATLPGYEHVELRDVADRVLGQGEMNDLERDVLKRTWLLDPLSALAPDVFSGPAHDRIVHEFDDLVSLANESTSGPIFAWIHLPAPHLPLVVDDQGGLIPLDPRLFDGGVPADFGMTDSDFAAAYASEIAYLNWRTLDAISALQHAPGHSDPVIVVMSDHGYAYDLNDLQARFGNFFAAATPGAPGLLAHDPTPVNVMGLLLNEYLGTDFPESPDRYFTSQSGSELFPLTEVANPDGQSQ
jgi:Sulfatase